MSDEVDKTSKNEQGFPLYPKMVYPNGPGTEAVIVNNIKHEMEVMGVKKEQEPKQPSAGENVVKPNW